MSEPITSEEIRAKALSSMFRRIEMVADSINQAGYKDHAGELRAAASYIKIHGVEFYRLASKTEGKVEEKACVCGQRGAHYCTGKPKDGGGLKGFCDQMDRLSPAPTPSVEENREPCDMCEGHGRIVQMTTEKQETCEECGGTGYQSPTPECEPRNGDRVVIEKKGGA